MIETLKTKFYFLAAWYFRVFAQIKLSRWKPRVIVVTGSSGKTTLLHFVESQLADHAKFSHHANSSIGIPFDILGLERKTLYFSEWPSLILSAPIKAFSRIPDKKFYVAECDCDRPGEGHFLANFLKPEVTLWISLSRTHTVNFDHLVANGSFQTVEEAVAYEFGYFIEKTTGCVIINADSDLMKKQLVRTSAEVKEASYENVQTYYLGPTGTIFRINLKQYTLHDLQPREVAYSIQESLLLMEYLHMQADELFMDLHMPPGRSTVYKGLKNTKLIDSTYNANLSSMAAILSMFEDYKSDKKWVVLGDMRELGNEDKEEHEKLAKILSKMNLQKIILMGPSITKYTYPHLKKLLDSDQKIIACENHSQTFEYLKQNIQGEEVILFKSSQSQVFEGFIEPLLAYPDKDAKTLPRREITWIDYRKQKGF